MKSLSKNLKDILSRIKKADSILLFLDYDGTLTPIVKTPNKAILQTKTKNILKSLIKNKSVELSIVTGRSLADIKRLVGLKGIRYCGSHGLDIDSVPKRGVLKKALKSKIHIAKIKRSLLSKLKNITGYEIEDKKLILALHYRNVSSSQLPALKKAFYSVSKPYIDKGLLKSASGKKVYEIRPNLDWDKGSYCKYLLKDLGGFKKNIIPIYIGDDTTDEAAFKALKKKGITVFVKGERKTSLAEYYLNSTGEVISFLKKLNP